MTESSDPISAGIAVAHSTSCGSYNSFALDTECFHRTAWVLGRGLSAWNVYLVHAGFDTELYPQTWRQATCWSPQDYAVNAQLMDSQRQTHKWTTYGITHFAELREHLSFGKVTVMAVKTLWSHDSSLQNRSHFQNTSAVWLTLHGQQRDLAPFLHLTRPWSDGIYSLF